MDANDRAAMLRQVEKMDYAAAAAEIPQVEEYLAALKTRAKGAPEKIVRIEVRSKSEAGVRRCGKFWGVDPVVVEVVESEAATLRAEPLLIVRNPEPAPAPPPPAPESTSRSAPTIAPPKAEAAAVAAAAAATKAVEGK